MNPWDLPVDALAPGVLLATNTRPSSSPVLCDSRSLLIARDFDVRQMIIYNGPSPLPSFIFKTHKHRGALQQFAMSALDVDELLAPTIVQASASNDRLSHHDICDLRRSH